MRFVERTSLVVLVASLAVLVASRALSMSSTLLDVQMWIVASAAWCALAVRTLSGDALQHLQVRRNVMIALAIAALLAMPLRDLASDDALRYLWDGVVVAAGDNPYASSPLQEPLVQHRIQLPNGTLLPDDMPYASMRTIYPPGMQLIGGAMVTLLGVPTVMGFELLWWGVVMALLCAALATAHSNDRPMIALACLSPIVLLHALGDIHSDALMAAIALLGVIALSRGRWMLASSMIAIAISIKYVPLLLIPALLRGRTRREQVIVLSIVCGIVGATYAPFIVSSGSVIGSLPVFAAHWQANSLVYSVLSWVCSTWLAPEHIRLVLGILALVLISAIWRRHHTQPLAAAMMTYLALLICSPIVHAWYITLPVLLFPFAPLRSTITWATTMCVYGLFYATYKGDGVWFEHPVALAVEFIPVCIAFARDVQFGPLLLRDEHRASCTALT